jgi:hypothetical protein
MKERVHSFGPDKVLVGVSTEPAPEVLRPGAPTVILSNVGLNHRVGPFRVWVELARRLAALGFPTLRFDLSGLGDSEPRRDTHGELERAVLDMQESMDFLQHKKGASKFVLMGLCSGVDSVHTVSVKDPRVAGAVWIDGYAYRTTGYYLRRYTSHYLNPNRWRRFIARKRLERNLHKERQETGVGEEIYVREYPTEQKLSQDLDALVARQAKLLFIYTGGVHYTYNYGTQFFDMFQKDYRGRIDIDFFERADHLFSFLADRLALLDRLTSWMDTSFPRAASKEEAA